MMQSCMSENEREVCMQGNETARKRSRSNNAAKAFVVNTEEEWLLFEVKGTSALPNCQNTLWQMREMVHYSKLME